MKSVADDLRNEIGATVLAMPVADRIALALALGDDDLSLYMRAAGLERDAALRLLRQQRARGRAVRSRSAALDE